MIKKYVIFVSLKFFLPCNKNVSYHSNQDESQSLTDFQAFKTLILTSINNAKEVDYFQLNNFYSSREQEM